MNNNIDTKDEKKIYKERKFDILNADIDVLALGVVQQEVDHGVCEIVHVQELPPRGARAPHLDRRRPGHGGVVDASQQRREHVAVLGVERVPRAVEVARHHRDAVQSVLVAIEAPELERGDLRDRVPLVGGLERAGEQGLLRDRLGGQPWVDA